MKKLNLTEWRNAVLAGKFYSKGVKTQVKAGWKDLYCPGDMLRDKTYKLAPLVMELMNSKLFDNDTTTVSLQNYSSSDPDADGFDIEDSSTLHAWFILPDGKDKYTVMYVDDYGMPDPEEVLKNVLWNKVLKYFGV